MSDSNVVTPFEVETRAREAAGERARLDQEIARRLRAGQTTREVAEELRAFLSKETHVSSEPLSDCGVFKAAFYALQKAGTLHLIGEGHCRRVDFSGDAVLVAIEGIVAAADPDADMRPICTTPCGADLRREIAGRKAGDISVEVIAATIIKWASESEFLSYEIGEDARALYAQMLRFRSARDETEDGKSPWSLSSVQMEELKLLISSIRPDFAAWLAIAGRDAAKSSATSATTSTAASKFRGVNEPVVEPITSGIAEKPNDLVVGILKRGGLTLVAGPPKSGKTWVVAYMLGQVERGEPFLGHETSKADAVYLSEEDGATTSETLKRFRVERARLVGRDVMLQGEGLEAAVADAVAEAKRSGAGVLVIDTLSSWSGMTGDEENESSATTAVLRPLQQAAADGFAVVAIVHTRKNGVGRGDPSGSVRGSSALVGGADVLVTLERDDLRAIDAPTRTLSIVSRFANKSEKLFVELRGSEYVVLDGASAARESRAVRRVVAVLEAADGVALTGDQIPKRAGMNKQAALKALAELVAAGRVDRTGAGTRVEPLRFLLAGR